LTGHRTIGIQEAVHNIGGLELVLCSDYMTEVSLGKALYMRKNDKEPVFKKNDLVSSYRNRPADLDDLSLERYFYEHFRSRKFYKDETSKRDKYRILVPKGLNCRPRYPVNYAYARGMIAMHKPWSVRNPMQDLLQDKERTVQTFLDMIGKRELPLYVISEYHRAVTYSRQYKHECLQREATNMTPELDFLNMDEDERRQYEHWEHSCHLSAQNTRRSSNQIGDNCAYIGIDYDWSKRVFKGIRGIGTTMGETFPDYLKDFFYGTAQSTHIHVPQKKNKSDYILEDLNFEQQSVVICALDAVIKFVNNDPTYEPLRATVVGCGGTGKSFIINTLVSILRKYTNRNDSIRVAAPTGGAAYNVQGCTLHRCLRLSVDSTQLSRPLSDDKQVELASELERLLMLIVDERSMLSSKLIAAAERNLRHCVYGQQNQMEKWGGVPVIIIFGDDYQLMPVIDGGAIQGYAEKTGLKVPKSTFKSHEEQILENLGHVLFIDCMTENVFALTDNYRTRNDPVFGKILNDLRMGILSDKDALRLMKQGLHHHNSQPENRKLIENNPRTVWLFTNNIDKNQKNMEKIVELSNRTGVPIARLRCQWDSNRFQGSGVRSVVRSHFKNSKLVACTDICVGAPVAINGINIVPEAGLYNGARGWVIDIVYDTVEGPNNQLQNHLPRYVVVDFPGLKLGKAKPWDENNPTVSLGYIICPRRYPLILSNSFTLIMTL
jgi:hypothetical protein